MRIEHFALQVPEPIQMADWYVKNLGCQVARTGGEPAHARFLKDGNGAVMLELYHNPKVSVPDYSKVDPLWLHIAFLSENLTDDRDRLVKAGAVVVDDHAKTPAGDEILMLRDPWKIPIQLVKRAQQML